MHMTLKFHSFQLSVILNPPVQILRLFHEVKISLFANYNKIKSKEKGYYRDEKVQKTTFVSRNLKTSIKKKELVEKTQT